MICICLYNVLSSNTHACMFPLATFSHTTLPFFVCIFVLFIVFIYMFVPLLVNEITNILLISPPFSDRIKINKLVHRIIETLCMLKPVTKKEILTKSTSEKYSHGKLRN